MSKKKSSPRTDFSAVILRTQVNIEKNQLARIEVELVNEHDDLFFKQKSPSCLRILIYCLCKVPDI